MKAGIEFKDGKFLGLGVVDGKERAWTYHPHRLAELGLLSITDRMILDQMAARVEAIVRKLAEIEGEKFQ